MMAGFQKMPSQAHIDAQPTLHKQSHHKIVEQGENEGVIGDLHVHSEQIYLKVIVNDFCGHHIPMTLLGCNGSKKQ